MIRKIGVVGAGMMGQGVCWAAAQRGIDVIFREVNEKAVQRAMKGLDASLNQQIDRWALTKTEKTVILSRIQGTTDLAALKDVEMIVETVTDTQEAKQKVYKEIDAALPDSIVLASNTSVLSITELASAIKNPERMVGMHFLNPVPARPLVEVVRGLQTSDATVAKAREFGAAIKKTCIEVFEAPGYVTTRLIIPFINEAVTVVMEGIASAEDVDTSMRLGFDFPAGPLEMADRMGLDQVMFWMEELFREYGSVRYRPTMLIRKLVRAGNLGVKTGQGFFKYDANGRRTNGNGE